MQLEVDTYRRHGHTWRSTRVGDTHMHTRASVANHVSRRAHLVCHACSRGVRVMTMSTPSRPRSASSVIPSISTPHLHTTLSPPLSPTRSHSSSPLPHPTYTLLLVGAAGVGKSTLLHAITTQTWDVTHIHIEPWIAHEMQIKLGEQRVQLQVIEVPAEHTQHEIATRLFTSCDGVCILYDVTRIETWHAVDTWLTHMDVMGARDDVVTMVVATQIDCVVAVWTRPNTAGGAIMMQTRGGTCATMHTQRIHCQ